jgi:hypothetical protein
LVLNRVACPKSRAGSAVKTRHGPPCGLASATSQPPGQHHTGPGYSWTGNSLPGPQRAQSPAAPSTTVEDMFVQTASGFRTDDWTMTLLGLTPHTIYFSDRPERIVGHLTTHRFLQWWSEGEDSFAVDPPNAVLAWGEPGTDAPQEAVVIISDPAVTADGLEYHIQTLQGQPPAPNGSCQSAASGLVNLGRLLWR